MPEVAKQTRVCRYERANNFSGLSDPAPLPRTGADVAADLHALLEAADVRGPYVLVGRSLSGIFVRLYAAAYPDDVVGMVLVDTTHETEQAILDPVLTPEEREVTRQLDFEGEDPEGFWTPEGLDALFAEMREARSASPLSPMPLVVLAAGQTEDLTEYGSRKNNESSGSIFAVRACARRPTGGNASVSERSDALAFALQPDYGAAGRAPIAAAGATGRTASTTTCESESERTGAIYQSVLILQRQR